ncbi:MAG TPA: sulfatase-like hydrolase/transferase [Acidobacteriaceae bacterium]|nr:sulfatase-like hydrolase/transferase [Acidobacteriaceae bacterium]
MTERAQLRWRHVLKRLCQCIGLASLILVVNYGDLLGGGSDVRMHVPYPLTGICLAQVADILLLGLVLFVVLAFAARTTYYSWVRLMVMILAPPYLLERTRTVSPLTLTDGVILIVGVVWAALLLLLLLRFPLGYRRVIRIGDAVGVFFAIFGICSIVQLLWVMAWRPGPQQIKAAWSKSPQSPRVHPRVVWVLFDELSYDQLFEHRAHDLALPNFDALRAQSTLYTNMQPVGLKTVKIVPSLLSGAAVDDFRYEFNNSFRVHYDGVHGWHPLDGSGTIFHDAERAGWRTAAVGWYNPYCTIYRSALDSCYWTNLDRTDGDMAQRYSLWRNTARPFQGLVIQLFSPVLADRRSCDFDVRQRLQTDLSLQQHAMELLKQDQADFIFLHLPIPHSPNIWSRVNDEYAHGCGSSYLDNLALADRTLGAMMAVLQQSPRWKDTTVIVQGDHAWRIMLWDWLPAWTEEDDQASRGEFDSRPALLIHNAGQMQALTDGRALSLLFVHDALEDVVQGKAVSPVKQRQATPAAGRAVVRQAPWSETSSR